MSFGETIIEQGNAPIEAFDAVYSYIGHAAGLSTWEDVITATKIIWDSAWSPTHQRSTDANNMRAIELANQFVDRLSAASCENAAVNVDAMTKFALRITTQDAGAAMTFALRVADLLREADVCTETILNYYKGVCVEGMIGVGKSTLLEKIAEHHNDTIALREHMSDRLLQMSFSKEGGLSRLAFEMTALMAGSTRLDSMYINFRNHSTLFRIIVERTPLENVIFALNSVRCNSMSVADFDEYMREYRGSRNVDKHTAICDRVLTVRLWAPLEALLDRMCKRGTKVEVDEYTYAYLATLQETYFFDMLYRLRTQSRPIHVADWTTCGNWYDIQPPRDSEDASSCERPRDVHRFLVEYSDTCASESFLPSIVDFDCKKYMEMDATPIGRTLFLDKVMRRVFSSHARLVAIRIVGEHELGIDVGELYHLHCPTCPITALGT